MEDKGDHDLIPSPPRGYSLHSQSPSQSSHMSEDKGDRDLIHFLPNQDTDMVMATVLLLPDEGI